MNNCLIKIKNLEYTTLNNTKILKSISAKFYKNKIYGIIGINGSGKTTFGNCLMGLNLDYKGDILFKNDIKLDSEYDITKRSKLGIHLAWQEPARFEGITINQYLSINKAKDYDIDKILKKVGLKPKKYKNRLLNKTLSGGERKRIELASLLLLNPVVSILDEPDSGIDIDSIEILSNSIKSLRNKNSCVILITHNQYMLRLCDTVYMMKKGKLVKAERK